MPVCIRHLRYFVSKRRGAHVPSLSSCTFAPLRGRFPSVIRSRPFDFLFAWQCTMRSALILGTIIFSSLMATDAFARGGATIGLGNVGHHLKSRASNPPDKGVSVHPGHSKGKKARSKGHNVPSSHRKGF